MLWLPPSAPGRYLTSAENITVTAGATAHTKGAWTELIASTPADAFGVFVMMANVGAAAADTAMLVDIGVGAAGSERVVIPDLNAGAAMNGSARFGKRVCFPLYIPAGSRIAARAQAAVASDTVVVYLFLSGDPPGPLPIGTQVVALGVDAANSRGTAIAASNAWTQVVASTSDAYLWWDVLVGQNGDTTMAAGILSVDIGFGAAGAETVIAHKLWSATAGEEIRGNMPEGAVFRPLPAGTRIAVRQSDAAARDAVVYAVR